MASLNTKTLSQAELSELELAYGRSPDTYKPLVEAYLSLGRFMEAMVVCKRAAKTYPNASAPRYLLARVYLDQGKDKKCQEELASALAAFPNDKALLRLLGQSQLKGGDQTGATHLLRAYQLDANDPETLQLMQQFQIETTRQIPPPPVSAPPVLSPSAMSLPPVSSHRPNQPYARAEAEIAVAPASAPAERPRVQPPPPPRRSVPSYQEEALSDIQEMPSRFNRKASGSKSLFIFLVVAGSLAGAGYYGFGKYKATRNREVKSVLQQAGDAFKSDTFASYKKASDLSEKALNIDPSSGLAHTYAAYAYTVRWGEHEHDDNIRARAEEHLREAKASGEVYAHLYAAEALFKYYSGKGTEARTTLGDFVKKLEGEGKRPALLELTLGIIAANQGDLEAAKEILERAQSNAPDDPRVYAALGNLNRRRGNDASAFANFDTALRYTRQSHPDALLGIVMAVLDRPSPDQGYVLAAKYLKTLVDLDPPPSPRQLAIAHFARAFLVSRVSTEIPLYTDRSFQKQLEEGTKVSADAARAKAEISKEEEAGLALDRNGAELQLIRGKRLAFEQKIDEGAAAIRKAIEMNPGFAHYHVELARVLLLKRDGGEKQAEEALRKALTMAPSSSKLLTMLGQAQYAQRKADGKKIDEAKETLERAVADANAKNPDARSLLARLYRDDKKDLSRAAELFEKAAVEYYSDPTNAAFVYDELAQTYEAKGDKDKARANFEKSLTADKQYSATYCHYVKFLTKLNDAKDKDRVKSLAQELLKIDAKSECAADMQRVVQG
jgi:cellulose synthase operon protein C